MSKFRGKIQLSVPGEIDAEVFLLNSDGSVAKTARVQLNGTYAIEPPPGYAGGWLLGKLYRPVVGARAVAVSGQPQTHDMDIGGALALTGRIVMPANVPLEWLDVHLTPRSLDGLPAEVHDALLATGPEPVRKGTYVTERIRKPELAFSVMPGEYRLEVERVFYDSPSTTAPPVNVRLASVTVENGPPAKEAPIGVWLDVRQPLSVVVNMAVVDPEDL